MKELNQNINADLLWMVRLSEQFYFLYLHEFSKISKENVLLLKRM